MLVLKLLLKGGGGGRFAELIQQPKISITSAGAVDREFVCTGGILEIGVRGSPERDISSLGAMGWGPAAGRNSSRHAVAAGSNILKFRIVKMYICSKC